MASASPPPGFSAVQGQFSALLQTLSKDGERSRSVDERRLLIDQIRAALDRGEARLSQEPATVVANTFLLEERIHAGTSTEVHRARHRDLGTYHAIKTLKEQHAGDPVASRLLLHEATIGLALRHPDIVATQALLRLADGRPALVFEWSGRSLADHLRQGPISLADIHAVMTALLSALSCMHDAGWVHCDVSPDNLLMEADRPGTVRLGDFGVAVAAGLRQSDLDLSFAGQPAFAAPEQIAGEPLDGRSDLYAAGRLLSVLLDHCDEHPHGSSAISTLRAMAATLSHRSPEERPQNAKAAQVLLGGFRV